MRPPPGCDMALCTTSGGNTQLILDRSETLLLLATMTDGYAQCGAYTGALADELRKADNKTDILEMHWNAVDKMSRSPNCWWQCPELRSTLKRKLVFPGSSRSHNRNYPFFNPPHQTRVTSPEQAYRIKVRIDFVTQPLNNKSLLKAVCPQFPC